MGRDETAALGLLERSLASWRDVPLHDVPLSLPLRAAVDALQEERQVTFESWADAGLALGRHRELLPALQREVARFPLRERPWGQLMLALFRSSRRADALRMFQRLRLGLVGELGLEPCQELRRLHERIIADDPALHAAAPTAPRVLPATPG